jgi:hypothetical protein
VLQSLLGRRTLIKMLDVLALLIVTYRYSAEPDRAADLDQDARQDLLAPQRCVRGQPQLRAGETSIGAYRYVSVLVGTFPHIVSWNSCDVGTYLPCYHLVNAKVSDARFLAIREQRAGVPWSLTEDLYSVRNRW